MKKLLLAGGACLLRICAILAVVGIASVFAPSSYAQTPSYHLVFEGFPSGSVQLANYIGLDRKLKTNVPGHILHIQVAPPLTRPQRVRLSIAVSAQGSSLSECNTQIATAVTVPFDISGSGRDLGASDFTGSSGIGVETSTENQSCIDALSDKITQGVPAIPTGIYSLNVVLNDATTGAMLQTGSHQITILAASTNEAILNLTSPANGDQVPATGQVVFQFDNSIGGRLLVFEHSSMTQSSDDATRDLNSQLKVVDREFPAGSYTSTAASPSATLRPWTAGRKYSWYFLGSFGTGMTGSDVRKSPIWSFTLIPSDPIYGQLVSALTQAPDPVGSTFNNLLNSGYMLNITLPFYIQEGENTTPQQFTASQIRDFILGLASLNVTLSAGVVNQ
jgi:hypothetical protein